MPFDRFYIEDPLELGATALLKDAEHHHLAHVMRVQIGETVELVNGNGVLATASMVSLGKKVAELNIEKVHQEKKSLPQVLLAVPLLRPSKLEWILEKGTELGVDTFYLYPSNRGEKKGLSSSQLDRLNAILIAAMKQSGRLFLPHLEILSHFSRLFQKGANIFYGDLRKQAKSPKEFDLPILFVSGPEAGFSEEETKALEKVGSGIRLNSSTLRAETAPIAAAAIFAYCRQL